MNRYPRSLPSEGIEVTGSNRYYGTRTLRAQRNNVKWDMGMDKRVHNQD